MSADGESPTAGVLARTDLVLDCLPRAVVVWDLHGTIRAWNRAAHDIYGWRADEVLGRHIGEVLIPPEDLEQGYEIALSVEAGEPWAGELTICRVDGEPVRISASLVPLRDDHGTIVGSVGSGDDVTHQRIVEQRAAELTNHLLLALAGGELGTWRWDIASGSVHWDTTMERLFGIAPGSFGGTYDAYAAMLHPEDRDATLAAIRRSVEEQTSLQVEHRVIWPDGTVRWLQGRAMVTLGADGTVSGAIGCTGDVTGRKQSELDIADRARQAEDLVEEGRRQRHRLEFLAEINSAALAANHHRELMGDVTAVAVPTLGDWCAIHFVAGPGSASATSPEIVVAHWNPARIAQIHDLLVKHPFDPDAPIGAAAAIRQGATQFIPSFEAIREAVIANAVRAAPDEARVILDELQLASMIAVPLVTRRGVIGAMTFVTAESGRLYDDDDVSLAETAAGRVAEALDAAWQRDQQRNVAAVLQSALLPPNLPEIEGVSVAVRYWAAGEMSEVGGDFYDVFRIADPDRERWAVVIGDVCGTGPEAAAVTAIARHTVRAAVNHGCSPVEVLEWLNDAIRSSDHDRFCTVLYAELEPAGAGRWTLTSVAGGHPPPWLVGADGVARPVGPPGTLLGVLPQLRLTPETTDLAPGDTLVLNTDGITDVPAPYGIDDAHMAAMVAAAAGRNGPAEQVAEALGEAVQAVLPLDRRDDDIALVVLRVAGAPNSVMASDAVDGRLLAERSFSAEPRSVAAAREFVVEVAHAPALSDSLRLAVSELATNAVIHAGSGFTIRVWRSGANVRVDVADDSPTLPVRQERRPDAAGGRGIAIVEHLAAAWGVIPTPTGKSVWFELSP